MACHSISVYIGPSPREREKEKRKDRREKNVQTTLTRTYYLQAQQALTPGNMESIIRMCAHGV